jgi:hypothetical protein
MKTILPSTRRNRSNGNGNHSEAPKLEVKINAPNIDTMVVEIEGTSPLVVHRFSAKAKAAMIDKMINPPKRGTKPKREPLDPEAMYNAARYISKDGWDGFNAAAIRNAMISACRLGNMKMTIAKLSVFVIADGLDKDEPQYNLVRIYGERTRLDAIGRLDNGAPNPVYRPMYFPWSAKLKIAFDTDQLSKDDVANLLHRVGTQIGLCEGRYDSKNSAGQGWGCFQIAKKSKKA